jgi:hypothetical protein
MASFTVPATGIYRAANGDARQFFQNDVIDLNTAIYFQMAGAALPAVVDNSPAGLRTAIDANSTLIDEVATLDVSDDFVSGTIAAGQIGSLGWTLSGGPAAAFQPSEANHPGIVRRDTSATISTVAYTVLRQSSTSGVILPSASFDMTWVFRANQTDPDTRIRIGMSSDISSDTPVDAIYIEKILTDTQWFGVCRASSVQTRTPVLATVDTGWHKIRIRRIDANTIGFTFDAAAEVTLATNVPTAVCSVGFHIFNGAAASKTLDIDLFRLRMTGLVR